jgi:hypothetical protein
VRTARPVALVLAALLAASAGLLTSCATAPARSPAEWMGVLPDDSTLYVSLSVPSSAALLKKMLKDAGPDAADVGQLVDMTQRVVLAVTLVPGGKPGFAAAAIGSYPSGIIGCRLSGNRDWKSTKGAAGRFWKSSRTGLEVAIPGRSVLLAANGGIETLLSRSAAPGVLRVPEEVALDMQRTDLVLYLPQLPGGLAQGSSTVRVPIQEVWLDAERRGGKYEVTGTANTGSEREAKLVALVMRLALVAWMRGQNVPNAVERLKPVTIEARGPQVKMSGLSFSEEEIGPLFLSLVAPKPQVEAAGRDQGPGQPQ